MSDLKGPEAATRREQLSKEDILAEYAVRCPKCGMEAVASMVHTGTRGTYQEPFLELGAARITCVHCGFARDTLAGKESEYELWYATELEGHRLWATNRRHLSFLIDWLESGADKRVPNIATRAMLAALPKWFCSVRNRAAILDRLRKLRGDTHR